jgi:hypothetical protein
MIGACATQRNCWLSPSNNEGFPRVSRPSVPPRCLARRDGYGDGDECVRAVAWRDGASGAEAARRATAARRVRGPRWE